MEGYSMNIYFTWVLRVFSQWKCATVKSLYNLVSQKPLRRNACSCRRFWRSTTHRRIYAKQPGPRITFPGIRRPGRGVKHLPPTTAEVKERVELYLYSPSGSSWPVLRWKFPLYEMQLWLSKDFIFLSLSLSQSPCANMINTKRLMYIKYDSELSECSETSRFIRYLSHLSHGKNLRLTCFSVQQSFNILLVNNSFFVTHLTLALACVRGPTCRCVYS